MALMLRRGSLAAMIGLALAAGCGDSPKGRTFYERNVEPILLQKCAGNTSGCHAIKEGDAFAVAAGNLDVTSFENVQKRRDVLIPFGAYPFSLFLIKAVGAKKLKLQYGDVFRDIDVQHVGESIIEPGSDAFFTLQQWLENGATENGLKPATPPREGEGPCSTEVPAGFNAGVFTSNPGFATFQSQVQPILEAHNCGAGSCHGAPQSDFYITCGSSNEQLAFNFSQAWAFVNEPTDDSQLLRVPLAVEGGGRGHTGGDQFVSTADPEYVKIKEWATSVRKRPFTLTEPGFTFFKDRVQPLLLQRGCAFQACHSPQSSNDFKLRSGAVGFFSPVALEKNYQLLKEEFMALEFPDARRSRAVAKTILEEDDRYDAPGGIPHRGGPVLETPASPGQPDTQSDPAVCGTYDPAATPPPTAFCTIQEWLRIERAQLAAEVTPMDAGDPIRIVYVNRPAGGATAGRLEFEMSQGGSDLRVVATTFGARQQITPVAAGGTSLLGGCNGLDATTADIQHPSVALDGDRIAFAGRNGPGEPLSIWVVKIDGTACTRITPIAPDVNGMKIHNFDPVWAPDGSAIVFASTRGKAGPTRSRKRFLPQSDLWRVPMNGTNAAGAPEQMTFLSNSELGPAFMREGRVTMTTEKVSGGFYQLSGRRINWDLTDYHPLLAQRKDSPYAALSDLASTAPSVGYSSATDIQEAANGDFLMILTDTDATTGMPALRGAAGALAIFSRSIGPFEATRNNEGYLRAMRIVPGATGLAGTATGFRRPVALPDGTIMAAYTADNGNTFQIVAVDPRPGANGARTTLITGGGGAQVDAVLAYKHPKRKLYANRRQLVFGGDAALGDADHAVLHMPDAPMVFTLLTGNLRRGRPVDAFRSARYLAVYSEGLCPSGNCTANMNGIFESRTMLGRAELADDGSVRVRLPSRTGVVLELQDGSGTSLVRMGEEHQLGPGERTSMGVRQELYNAVCGGCHGSISGSELDVAPTPDALTGASSSASAGRTDNIGN
jgi:WD40-like Beta Propeller Repeat